MPTAIKQDRYFQGTTWSPDEYSLGPAAVAAAGAQACALCSELIVEHKGGNLTASDLLGCLDLMVQLTKLARTMVSEAAGKLNSVKPVKGSAGKRKYSMGRLVELATASAPHPCALMLLDAMARAMVKQVQSILPRCCADCQCMPSLDYCKA
jgi:hypothetical protein